MDFKQEIKEIRASLSLIQNRLKALETPKPPSEAAAGRQSLNFEIEDYISLMFTADPAYLKEFVPVKQLAKETAIALNRELNTGFVKRFGMMMNKLGFVADVRKIISKAVRGYHVGRIIHADLDKAVDYLKEHFEAGGEQISVAEIAAELSNTLLVLNDLRLRRVIGLHFAANGIKSFPTTIEGKAARIYKLRRK